ncbi:TonB-dependent receptor [Edaphobacter albus]|uniref:TonB-dependent receptor n=1 Tax=Edaphobacter sp. 4G125 TaxID=2763071 RepID=UPI001647B9E4|nr:TonB-dependent receptor [Edaphobacter sp. 4G125]QNI36891.1 TonB-dependent receptor [Edaphobacter sp. 4G125]
MIIVEDATGAILPRAEVTLQCAGQRDLRQVTDTQGTATFTAPDTAPCSATASAEGFVTATHIFAEESQVEIRLAVAANTQVTVSAGSEQLQANIPTAQGVLSEQQIAAIPFFNRATGFSDLITRTTPGVAADANGFAHPLGEHADTSISLDGQPITDQQAKVFSNQLDTNIIQSLTAITGAPPAEFGDKTSLVITVNARSGLGRRPSGTLSSEYGSFGTWGTGLVLGAGGKRWGNFVALHGEGSGRFLDSPEFVPLHDHGNSEGFFDRIDWQPGNKNLFHLNLGGSRSWFQTPNSYDTAAAEQDQRSQIRNANIAFGWNYIFSPSLLAAFTPFYRHEEAQYFPSANPLADTTATMAQNRMLTNTGFRLETVYAKGVHTAKIGGTYWHTLLHERFSIALTDPLYNAPCIDSAGNSIVAPGISDSSDCAKEDYTANPAFLANLLPYDLTRGGTLYDFDQTADIEQAAFYAQDDIKWGHWLLSPGLRYDIYNGLSRGRQIQPRLGIGYRLGSTLLRGSYARLYETPYNENLIFANESSADTTSKNPFATYRSEPVRPGTRNQFNIGFEQSFGNHLNVDADYYWKFTRTAFDFDTLFNTPITFSVAWRKSKIDGLALRVSLNDWHGLNAYSVMGHVRSRFFTPQVGGLIFGPPPPVPVFRIDHGEEFEQTTNFRYQLPSRLVGSHQLWIGGSWRYNSGLALPDTVPTYLDALQLTANQQAQMGLFCASERATPNYAIRECSPEAFGATRIRIPPYGTEDEDRNPVRVMPRTLFDLSVGNDNIFHTERFSVGAHVTAINLTNKDALYNFLSTFSGTHFIPPRTLQAGLSIRF